MKGIYVAFILFFVLFGLTFLDFYDEGYEWDYQSIGTAASGALVLIVNLQVRSLIRCKYLWCYIGLWIRLMYRGLFRMFKLCKCEH